MRLPLLILAFVFLLLGAFSLAVWITAADAHRERIQEQTEQMYEGVERLNRQCKARWPGRDKAYLRCLGNKHW